MNISNDERNIRQENQKIIDNLVKKYTVSKRWDDDVLRKVNVINKREVSDEIKAKEAAYWARIKNYVPRPKPQSQKRVVQSVMPIHDAKEKVWEIIQRYMRRDGYTYNIKNGNTAQVLGMLTAYFSNNPHPSVDEKKGIWLFGRVGCGKTLLLNVFKEFADKYNPQLAFEITHIKNVSQNIVEGSKNLSYYYQRQFGYDDIGFERVIKKYGNEINPFIDIVSNVYDRWLRFPRLLFCTSNMPVFPPSEKIQMDSAAKKYGERVADRCKQMLNIIYMTASSNRV